MFPIKIGGKEVKYEEVNCSSNTLSSKKVIKLKGVYASIE